MSAIAEERKALREAIGRGIGENTYQERIWVSQVKTAAVPADLFSLPAAGPGQWISLNVTDPGLLREGKATNPNYGKTLFVPGINTPGDGTVFG